MALEISLIGPPRVARDRQPVSFDTRKAMALLAHLALAERPRSREALCELLWPGRDPEHARGALRRTLSTLRKAVGEESIDTTGDSIALVPGADLALDVERFRELAADDASLEALAEAAALCSARFLEGFSLRDSPAFDDWQVGEARALERELAAVLRSLAMRLAAQGDYEQAIPHVRRWLELDPLHEPAHRELIRLYAWSGDRGGALEQYRECVRTLSQELGVAPVEETAALYDQVSEGTLAPPAATEAPPAPATPAKLGEPPAELPLMGREHELAALTDAHARAQPDGGLAVIEGEAGIGKTRLAQELARRARDEGAVVLAARCHEDEAGLPYGPIVELLHEAVSYIEPGALPAGLPPQRLADASLLLPELASLGAGVPDALPLDGPGAQVRVLEGVAAVIGAACEGPRPGVVLLDDVHAADEATLDAISYLGHRLRGRALLLVVSWRSEAVPPGHRLRRLAADLARDGRAAIVSPARLSEDEVGRLVQAVQPDAAAAGLERRVYLESEGLPLFVAEYLAALGTGGERAAGAATPRGAGPARGPAWRTRRRRSSGARRQRRPSGGPSISTRCARRAVEATRRPWARSRSSSRTVWSERSREPSRATTSRTRSCAPSSTTRPAWRGGGCFTGASPPRCRVTRRAKTRRWSLSTCAWRATTPVRRSTIASRQSTRPPCMPTPTHSSTSSRRSPSALPTPPPSTSASATCARS